MYDFLVHTATAGLRTFGRSLTNMAVYLGTDSVSLLMYADRI